MRLPQIEKFVLIVSKSKGSLYFLKSNNNLENYRSVLPSLQFFIKIYFIKTAGMKRKSLIILLCLNIAFGVLGVMSEVFDFMGIMGDIMPIICGFLDVIILILELAKSLRRNQEGNSSDLTRSFNKAPQSLTLRAMDMNKPRCHL